jgi:hypothetical protein
MSRRTGSAARLALGLAAALALGAPAGASAALSVRAQVDRAELAQDERLLLEVRVDGDEAPSVTFPAGDFGFTVAPLGRSQSTSVDLGGGAGVRIRKTFVHQYALTPLRTGDLTIPALEVTAGRASATTTPITVKVTPPGTGTGARGGGPGGGPGGGLPDPFGQALPRGNRGWNGWERDLALAVDLDRQEAFVGEQVTVNVSLLSAVEVVDRQGYQPPDYDGFWTEVLEQPDRLAPTVRTVKGVPLRDYLLERLALFPTRPGDLELGPYATEVVVRLAAPSQFYPDELRRERRRSQPVALRVKPLPPGAPDGFDPVNVAAATLTAALSTATAAPGQPVTLRLTAQGEGNVKSWALPAVPAVAGLRAYAPTTSDRLAARARRLTGSRTVETVLVARAEGTYVVPPVAWPVFDPRKGAYDVLRTPELTLQVAAPAAAAPAAAAPAPLPGENALAAGLRPIRPAGPLARRGEPPWQGALLWVLVAAPVALFALLGAVDRLRERRAAGRGARRLRDAGRVARRRLEAATRLAGGEAGPFFAEVERALTGYCGDKLGRAAGGLTREALAAALAEAGAHATALRALAAALDACDAGRFGGAADRAEVLSLASRAMELLEEAHWAAPGERR